VILGPDGKSGMDVFCAFAKKGFREDATGSDKGEKRGHFHRQGREDKGGNSKINWGGNGDGGRSHCSDGHYSTSTRENGRVKKKGVVNVIKRGEPNAEVLWRESKAPLAELKRR